MDAIQRQVHLLCAWGILLTTATECRVYCRDNVGTLDGLILNFILGSMEMEEICRAAQVAYHSSTQRVRTVVSVAFHRQCHLCCGPAGQLLAVPNR